MTAVPEVAPILNSVQLTEIVTDNYVPPAFQGPTASQQGLPVFNAHAIEWMLLDYQVQLCGSMLFAPILRPILNVTAKSPEIQTFIDDHIKRFWMKAIPKILMARFYTRSGGEQVFEFNDQGQLVFSDFHDIYPLDLSILHNKWKVYGLAYRNRPNDRENTDAHQSSSSDQK